MPQATDPPKRRILLGYLVAQLAFGLVAMTICIPSMQRWGAIFGASQSSDLNLITCNGDWDRGKATYTRRLVVYTSLLPEKTVRAGFTGAFD